MPKLTTRTTGTLLTGIGATHFLTPSLYEPATMTAFPTNTRAWVYRNGATEIILGLALRSKRTHLRQTGTAGLAAYTLGLAVKALSSR